MKTISILHTGGTIASKVGEKGGVSVKFDAKDVLNLYPEIKKLARITSRKVFNIWTEDMNFQHFNIMAKEVEREVKTGKDGIIITLGTDILHYAAAALSFILEDLPVSVILVGAQRSSDRGSTDAALNLVSAVNFINKTDFAEVAVCMHSSQEDTHCSIIQATKVRKIHTSRRDAFKSINVKPFALVYHDEGLDLLRKDYKKVNKNQNLKLKLFNPKIKVALLKAFPNFSSDLLKFFSDYDGLVIEGFGLGQFPVNKTDKLTSENAKIFLELKKLAKKMPVVMASQCIFGRINMNVYDTGRKLQSAGILGNLADMTPETAYIKLSWLLSNYKKSDVKNLISENLRGEISDRTSIEFLEDDFNQ